MFSPTHTQSALCMSSFPAASSLSWPHGAQRRKADPSLTAPYEVMLLYTTLLAGTGPFVPVQLC